MSNKMFSARIDEDLINRLKYIAWHDRETLTEIVTELLNKKIAAFEKKNGDITPDKLKDARIID